MTTTPDLFDSGLALKAEGQALVESHNHSFVEAMRAVARRICYCQGTVTSDDLRQYAIDNDMAPAHENCWGAIFRTGEFKAVGYTKSKLASNHARTIRVWALK